MKDSTSFFLAFTALYVVLLGYLWMLDRRARRLEERLAKLETLRPG